MKKTSRALSMMLSVAMVLALLSGVSFSSAAGDTVTITFDSQGGSAVAALANLAKNSAVTFPGNPARVGYTFAGWYTSPDGKQYEGVPTVGGGFGGVASLSVGASDATYYAQWIKDDSIKYVVTKASVAGPDVKLGYSEFSGKGLIYADGSPVNAAGYAADGTNPVFKDLNGNGKLDAYEDWRLDALARAADLAEKLTLKEQAGLMLYSSHQMSWTSPDIGYDQVTFLANDDLRHVLIAGTGNTADIHAKWSNSVQALSEKFGKGIPANNSSDPRHSAAVGVEFYSNNAGTMSIWPNSLGISATFDPDVMLQFGKIASKEYRAFGISTALSPQVDISTDPRWNRTNGTFGEDPKLSADMAGAYVKGFQGTFGGATGDASDTSGKWGYDSVNAMIKHWPGGGAGESGRDAHNDLGKYAVYPGGNIQAHIIPFVDGALSGTAGSIERATAVMPYYTISNNVDPTGTDVANALSKYMIDELLVGKYGFGGVVCTDWGVNSTRGWGPSIEDQTEQERTYQLIMSGVNQLGGVNTSRYIIMARDIALSKGTQAQFDAAMDVSAGKLLMNIFKTGLFENPYLDPAASVAIAKDAANNQAGFDAQVRAVVTLKNTIPTRAITPATKVYVPKNASGSYVFTNKGADGADKFIYTDNPKEADLAIYTLNSATNPGAPDMAFFGGGWYPDVPSAAYPMPRPAGVPAGFFPLTLQYSEYTAVNGREVSIVGDYRDKDVSVSASVLNRTYKDKTVTASNIGDLKTLLEIKEAMGNKPVITVLNLDNPPVMTEIDAVSDVVLARFACSDAAVLEILSGAKASTGMLPLQMPKDMAAVEFQLEDVPRDMACYVDSEGHTYDFGYGLTVVDGAVKVIGVETADARFDKYVTGNAVPLTAPVVNTTDNGIAGFVSFKTITLPVATVGAAYSAAIEANTPGTAISLVRVEQNVSGTAGTLPAGLSFAGGVISGTPTAAGCVQLVVKGEAAGKTERIYRLNLLVTATASTVKNDPNALSIQLTLAGAKTAENYTVSTWMDFNSALLAAKSVYAQAKAFTATQGQINAAEQALSKALSMLIREDEASIAVPLQKIVAGHAANIPAEVSLYGVPVGAAVSLYGPSGAKLSSMNASDNGRYVLTIKAQDAVEGTFTVKLESGGKVFAQKDVACVKQPENLWNPSAVAEGGMVKITFASEVSFNEAKKGAKLGTATVSADKISASGTTVVIDSAAASGNAVTVSGVKYADLFPSYSFSFTITIK